jgi:outer membrane protein assembly factor BamB
MAIRTGGRGDVSKTHVEWTVPTGAPYVSSLLYYEGLVYMANDAGIVTAVDPETGAKVWQERVPGIFTASPVAADGKVYLLSETGDAIVLRAGRPPVVLERNGLGQRMVASPAISNGQFFIRTDDHLIAIGKPR